MSLPRIAIAGAAALVVAALIGSCRDFGRFEALPNGGTSSVGGDGGVGGSGASGGAGGIATGGGGGAGGTVSLACGLIDGLADDFDTVPLDELKWSDSSGDGASVHLQDGALVLQFDADYSYADLVSEFSYDARGRAFEIEIEAVTLTSNHWVYITVGPDNDNYAELAFNGDTLNFFVEIDDNYNSIGNSVTFDPSLHRHLRFREDEGTVYYELSGDRVSWTEVASVPTASFGDWEHVGLFIGGDGDGMGTSGELRIAAIVGEGPSANCPIDTFSDDFADGTIGAEWGYGWQSSDCELYESNGVLELYSSAAAQSEDCAMGTGHAFDLTGGTATIEVVTPDPTVGVYFGVFDADEQNYIVWDLDESTLYLSVIEDGDWIDVVTSTYDSVAMRFIRIREEDGRLYWEGSPDGDTFTSFAERQTNIVDFSALRVRVGMYTSDSNAQEHTVQLDNLNILP